jgi:hypothetical protein
MLRNQQFVRGRFPKHLDSHQNRRQYHGVRAVHTDRLDGAETFSWPAVFSGEGHIVPNISCGTT